MFVYLRNFIFLIVANIVSQAKSIKNRYFNKKIVYFAKMMYNGSEVIAA